MVQFKHPHRFNALGCFRWNGIIYGDGALARRHGTDRVFHGRFGFAPFQMTYRQSKLSIWSYFTLLEWHLLAAFIASLSIAFRPLIVISAVMWCASSGSAVRSAAAARLGKGAPLWCRPLIFLLHLLQPIVRGGHRQMYRLARRFGRKAFPSESISNLKTISFRQFDLYWQSRHGVGRLELLHALADRAAAEGWHGDYRSEWQPHDVELIGDLWHDVRISTATEELGGAHRFTRARCTLSLTWISYVAGIATTLWLAGALIHRNPWPLSITAAALAAVATAICISRRRVKRATASLLTRAASACGLDPSALTDSQPAPQFSEDCSNDSELLPLKA